MNTQKRQAGAEGEFDSLVEELFKHASPRPQPPPAVEREVREAVYREWDQAVSRRITRRRAGWFAAAAAVLIMAGAATLALRPQLLFPRPVAVASIERIVGDISLSGSQSSVRPAAGIELLEGQALDTGLHAMVALRTAGGGSLRLAPGSAVKLAGTGRIELVAGTIYFDSYAGEDQPPAHLGVVTPLGLVRDIGTQFMVRLAPNLLAVSVREGLVTVQQDEDELVATVGERLTVGAGGKGIKRDAIPTYGEDWYWTETIAPGFQAEGRRLIDVLGWIARETGRELEFGSLDAQRSAGETTLGYTPSVELERLTAALTMVLATTDLQHRLVGSKIHLTLRTRDEAGH